MLSRLYNYYLIARESLFYTPAVICLIYTAACLGVYKLDFTYDQQFNEIPLLFNGGLEDAKEIVRILLSSMITLTVLVISITMVVLSLSASQLGPRLIRIFMSDRRTKMYMGLFFGSVAVCFVLTGLLHEVTSEAELPSLTVSVVFLICFANLFILLSYVQHVVQLSVADEIISKVHAELITSIRRLNSIAEEEDKENEPDQGSWPKDFDAKTQSVFYDQTGYIQACDYDRLKRLAHDNALRIEICFKPGDYVIQGEELVRIYPKNKSTPEIEKAAIDAIVFGAKRTGTQDVQYSVRHLVEIGLRALSPGINDNYTAITVLNKLAAALSELFKRTMPNRVYCDDKGKVLVKGPSFDQSDIIHEAFSKIRKAGEAKPDILSHLINVLKTLKKLSRSKTEKAALDKELSYIEDHINANFKGDGEGKALLKELKE